MSAWSRKGRSEYAEWFPEVDLHLRSRWPGEPTAPVPVITPVAAVGDEGELGETA